MATLTIKEMAAAAKGLFKESDKASALAASVNTKWKGFAVEVVMVNHPEVLNNNDAKREFRREFFSLYISETTKISAKDYQHYRTLNTEGRESFALTEEIQAAENRAKQYFGRVLKYLKEALEGKKDRNPASEALILFRKHCERGAKLVNKMVEEMGLGNESNARLKEYRAMCVVLQIQDFTK